MAIEVELPAIEVGREATGVELPSIQAEREAIKVGWVAIGVGWMSVGVGLIPIEVGWVSARVGWKSIDHELKPTRWRAIIPDRRIETRRPRTAALQKNAERDSSAMNLNCGNSAGLPPNGTSCGIANHGRTVRIFTRRVPMPRKPHSDREEYWKFTGPMRVSKAVHTLQGLLQGINLDGHVSESEFAAVRHWMAAHAALTRRAPFSEIAEILNEAISDGCLDGDEIEDILYVCKRLEPQSAYFQGVTAEMRTLQGVLAGVVADGIVTDDEIGQLSEWINNNCHMKGCWPYDEIESLLLEVRRDKSIDDRERALLLTFLSEFTTIFGKYAIDFPINELSKPISGLCAVCPEVTFTGKLFCFTGSSKRLKRKELADLVGKLGGSFHPRVTSDVHYLVIGGDGNPCWAFRDCFKTPQLADEPH